MPGQIRRQGDFVRKALAAGSRLGGVGTAEKVSGYAEGVGLKAVRFGHRLIRRGVYCTPGGKLYLSLAHTDAEIDRTLEIAAEALQAVR